MRRPLPFRLGELLLLFLFLAFLAGRFSLSRFSADPMAEPALDLRWLYLTAAVFGVMFWYGGAREYLPRRTPLVGVVPLAGWCAWMVASGLWAPEGARVEPAQLDFVFLFALVVCAWFVMSHLPSDSLDRVWGWLLITGLIYFVLAIASGPDVQGRYAAPGGGPNIFVRIMVVAALAALYLAVVRGKNWALLTIPVFAVGAALSGSRGGLLSAAVVLVVFAVPIVRRLGAARTIAIALCGVVGVVLAGFWRDGYLYAFVQERFIEQTFREGYSSGRNIIGDQSWEMFAANPLMGVGLDGFYPLQISIPGVVYEHPHNLVMATLSEAGLVGGVLLIAALLRLTLTAMGRTMPHGPLFALIAGLYFFGTALFSGDYYDSRFIWFFLGLSAAGMMRSRRQPPTPSVSPSPVRP